MIKHDFLDGAVDQVDLLRKVSKNGTKADAPKKRQIVMRRLSEIEPKSVRSLWANRIFAGEPCVIAGVPGVGKGFVAGAIAAAISRGVPPPGGGDLCEPGDVIVLSLEDDPSRVLRPRYEALGADLDRIHILDGIQVEGERLTPFSLSHIELLRQALDAYPSVRAIIIDPISSMLAGSDIWRSNEVREVFDPFLDLTSEREVAVIMNTHTNKSTTVTGAFRVEGSLGGFVGRARSVLAVGSDPETGIRGVGLLKTNLGRLDVPVIAFEIDATGRFSWIGESESISAQCLFEQAGSDDDKAASEEARDAILALLDHGEIGGTEMTKALRGQGHHDRTVQRARARLRREGEIEKVGGGRFGGPVRWRRKSIERQPAPYNATYNGGVLCNSVAVYENGAEESEELLLR